MSYVPLCPPGEMPCGSFASRFLVDCPAPGVFIGGFYRLNQDGTHALTTRRSRAVTQPIAFAPILPAELLWDRAAGLYYVKLAWQWKGEPWRSWLIREQDIGDKHVLPRLTRYGFPGAVQTAAALSTYVAETVKFNREAGLLPYREVDSIADEVSGR